MIKQIKLPHALVIMFGMAVSVAILSYIIPAGSFERSDSIVDGRLVVIPGTFTFITSSPIGFVDFISAFSLGFKAAAEIIFVVLSGGLMFALLEKTGALEKAIGIFVRKMGTERKLSIIVILSFVYGVLGIAVGYENNIALVPLAAMVSLAIGGDLILAAGISVGAMTVGFGLSPINPYTVGLGHKLADLPLFSGAVLRLVFCLVALSIVAWYNVRYFKRLQASPEKGLGIGLDESGLSFKKDQKNQKLSSRDILILVVFLGGISAIVYCIFEQGWFFNELSGGFLLIGLCVALIAGMDSMTISKSALQGIQVTAAGAFMVGFAASIKVLLEEASIIDTLCFYAAELLEGLPAVGSALLMTLTQSFTNFVIPSGSGQALATLPLMLPLGDLIGLSAQTTILAFQIGDGLTNLINPTLGGLIAMLSLCRVPLDRWIRFVFPLTLILLGLAWLVLIFATIINY